MTIRIPENTVFEKAYVFENEDIMSISVEAGASARLVLIALGTATARVRVELAGEGAEAQLYGLFMAGAGEKAAYYAEIEHLVPRCVSRQDFRGVVSGDGQGLFEGLIRVAPGAQETQAYQQSKGLLLSDLSVIETRPQLEIYADNVKCSHGATTGQLDPQAVFYMRQRGLSEDEARKLQLQGFVREIIGRIPPSEEAERIDALVSKKLSEL